MRRRKRNSDLPPVSFGTPVPVMSPTSAQSRPRADGKKHRTNASDAEQLPWAGFMQHRCHAVREPDYDYDGRPIGYYGRCELVAKHVPEIDHALERGMDTPRWSTRWSDYA